LTNHTLPNIISKLEEIFKAMGFPKTINCDNEFNKKQFNDFLDDHEIQPYYSQPYETNKNAIVERFNRTLIDKIALWRTAKKKYDWYKILPSIVENYNNTYHRTIKNKPTDVFNGEAKNKQERCLIKNEFKINDSVRKRLEKATFYKSDTQKLSKTIHTITKIEGNKIYLDNEDHFYKPYELLKVNKVHKYEKSDDDDEDEFDYDLNKQKKKTERTQKHIKKELDIRLNTSKTNPENEKRKPKENRKYKQ
jgi:hypothetical protein